MFVRGGLVRVRRTFIYCDLACGSREVFEVFVADVFRQKLQTRSGFGSFFEYGALLCSMSNAECSSYQFVFHANFWQKFSAMRMVRKRVA